MRAHYASIRSSRSVPPIFFDQAESSSGLSFKRVGNKTQQPDQNYYRKPSYQKAVVLNRQFKEPGATPTIVLFLSEENVKTLVKHLC